MDAVEVILIRYIHIYIYTYECLYTYLHICMFIYAVTLSLHPAPVVMSNSTLIIKIIEGGPRPVTAAPRFGPGNLFWYVCWYCFGMVLARRWYRFAKVLVWYWYCFAIVLHNGCISFVWCGY